MSHQAPGSLAARQRARDLGIPFDGVPGSLNAITDVAGVTVGFETLIFGEGRLEVGKGPVRTGVSAILPRGTSDDPVFGAWYALNGNGEMTGTTWVEESGFVEGPIMITNTHSVGIVRDAVVEWRSRRSRSRRGTRAGCCRWSRRPGTAFSTTPTAITSPRSTRSRLWIGRSPDRSPKAMSGAAPA